MFPLSICSQENILWRNVEHSGDFTGKDRFCDHHCLQRRTAVSSKDSTFHNMTNNAYIVPYAPKILFIMRCVSLYLFKDMGFAVPVSQVRKLRPLFPSMLSLHHLICSPYLQRWMEQFYLDSKSRYISEFQTSILMNTPLLLAAGRCYINTCVPAVSLICTAIVILALVFS